MAAACLVMAATLAAPTAARAADPPPGSTYPWSLSATFGTGGVGGGYGEFLEDTLDFDVNISKSLGGGPWRLGAGLQFGSMALKPPYQDQEEWAQLEPYIFATRMFRTGQRVRPYLQARANIVRMHPRGEIFNFAPPEELEPGDSPTKPANGFGFSVVPGLQLDLTRGLALDVAGFWKIFKADYDLEPIGRPPVSSGQSWGLRLGLAWTPLAEGVPPRAITGPDTPLPPPDVHRDAWGVPRSWGWATGQMLGINFGASMVNEYIRNANFNQISPRSFAHNIEEGFAFDDNQFRTNQLIHPMNGSTYFNSARSNGIGFWGSSLMALAGAFVWECCGETHPMSANDMISTGLGGIARGEWGYRLSSLILDNRRTGTKRILRELAAASVDTVRTFNRFVSGDATRVTGNPVDPHDWRPPHFALQLLAGSRTIGEGNSITENTTTAGFAELDIIYGSPWDNERRQPFDHFDTGIQLNFSDKHALGRLQIRGDLASWPIGGGDRPKHAIAITQDFDYIDNEAYEFAGQSFGLALSSRFQPSAKWDFSTLVKGFGTLMGAVNADYSFLADVGDRERFREYDYGPGLGGGLEVRLQRNRRTVFTAAYFYTWIQVRNGSVYQSDEFGGSDATHQVHRAGARLIVPVTRSLGLGVDSILFFRKSEYDAVFLADKDQRNPQVRFYLAWQPVN
jgi:hypothetical protein